MVEPLKQRKYEYTCGAYALVNCFHLSMFRMGKRQDRALLRHLLNILKEHSLAELGINLPKRGIMFRNLCRLADYFSSNLMSECNVKLSRRILSRSNALNINNFAENVERHLKTTPSTACLAGIESLTVEHWTCIKGFTAKSISLFDSAGYRRFKMEACDTEGFRKPRQRCRFWPAQTLLLNFEWPQ